jgi:hypothetical protein
MSEGLYLRLLLKAFLRQSVHVLRPLFKASLPQIVRASLQGLTAARYVQIPEDILL